MEEKTGGSSMCLAFLYSIAQSRRRRTEKEPRLPTQVAITDTHFCAKF